jgi:hypothetical protein
VFAGAETLLTVFGVVVHLVVPKAMLSMDLSLMLFFFLPLLFLLVILIFLIVNIEFVLVTIVVLAFLFWEKRAVRSISLPSFGGRRNRNRTTRVFFAIAVIAVFFLIATINVSLNLICIVNDMRIICDIAFITQPKPAAWGRNGSVSPSWSPFSSSLSFVSSSSFTSVAFPRSSQSSLLRGSRNSDPHDISTPASIAKHYEYITNAAYLEEVIERFRNVISNVASVTHPIQTVPSTSSSPAETQVQNLGRSHSYRRRALGVSPSFLSILDWRYVQLSSFAKTNDSVVKQLYRRQGRDYLATQHRVGDGDERADG